MRPQSAASALMALRLMARVQAASGRPEASESVFGIELTMIGATCAVSLPDGRFQGSASVNGSSDYVELLQTWYTLGTNRSTNSTDDVKSNVEARYAIYPAEDVSRIQAGWQSFLDLSDLPWLDRVQHNIGWKHRDVAELYKQDYYQGDESVVVLTDTLSHLHEAAFQTMEDQTNLTVEQLGRPFAVFTAPSWFFARFPAVADWAIEEDPELGGITQPGTAHLRALIGRISTAVHRAGFRLSVDDDPFSIMDKHERGNGMEVTPAGSKLLISQVFFGRCGEGDLSYMEVCNDHRLRGVKPRRAFAVDHQVVGTTHYYGLWTEMLGVGDYTPAWWHWSMDLGPGTRSKMEQAFLFREIAHTITKVTANDTAGVTSRSQQRNGTIIMSGSGWSAGDIDLLRESLAGQTSECEIREPQKSDSYLAALGAAEAARGHHRSAYVCYAPVEPMPEVEISAASIDKEL